MQEQKEQFEQIAPQIEKEWFSSEKKPELNQQETEEKKKVILESERRKISYPSNDGSVKDVDDVNKQDIKTKIKNLLNLANLNGVYYSIDIARKTKDPLLLDLYHDILAKNQLYKKFKE